MHKNKRLAKHIRLRKVTAFIVIYLFFTFTILPTYAKTIDKEMAKIIATNFFQSNIKTKSSSNDAVLKFSSSDFIISTKSSEAPTFYIFSTTKEKGFVIISGDDSINPILAYSFENGLPESSNIPPNLRIWFESVDQFVKTCRNKESSPLNNRQYDFDFSKTGSTKVLETANWNQDEPYNLQCPLDGDKRSVVGCSATAIAIAMRYHKWPLRGNGKSEAYTDDTGKYIPERSFEHPYDWDNMPLNYVEGEYSQQQAEAVSLLMSDVAHSIISRFTASETSAAMTNFMPALRKHFNYDKMNFHYRASFDDKQWMRLLKQEIDNNRPVIFSGCEKFYNLNLKECHLFVIDGYDGNSLLHVNWGWGGYLNGFFHINNLYEYTTENAIITNIQPNKENSIEENPHIAILRDITGPDIYINNTPFQLSCGVVCSYNIPDLTTECFEGYIRAAIVDKDNNIKEWISTEKEIKLKILYEMHLSFNNCIITQKINSGDKIRLFYKHFGTDLWNVCYAWESTKKIIWEIPITDSSTIRETTSVTYNDTEKKLQFHFKDNINPSVYFNGTLITKGIELLPNSVTIFTSKLQPGSYTLRLENNYESEEIKFSVVEL